MLCAAAVFIEFAERAYFYLIGAYSIHGKLR